MGDRRGQTDRCRDQAGSIPASLRLEGPQRNQRLAVPAWLGEQAADSRSLFFDAKGQARRLSWSYPGHLSMQCLAYYDDQHGLYAACNDTQALRKTFAMWGTADRQIHFETIHYPLNLAREEKRYSLPYQVVLGAFQGDWLTAAERYRAWAVKQSWAEQSRLRRGLTPDWVLETGAWVWNRGRSPGVLGPAVALREAGAARERLLALVARLCLRHRLPRIPSAARRRRTVSPGCRPGSRRRREPWCT